MKTIGYARVSTGKQAEKGRSIAEQVASIRGYAELHKLDLIGIERDEGFSAKTMDRPAFQRVLTMLREGEAQAVLVARLDRLTRNLRELLAMVDDLLVGGEKHLISVVDQIDTSGAMGRFYLSLLGALAQLEREQISERISAVLQFKRQNREYTGGIVPYGFTVVGNKLEAHPKEFEAIVKVAALREEGLSFLKIARNLNKLGFRNRNKNPFNQKDAWRMWKRIAELGEEQHVDV